MIQNGGGSLSLPPFYTLSAFETIGSTNTEVDRLAETGAVEGQLVWALSQDQGVGRRGRDWTSPKGNLYCSVLLKPECSAAEGAKLSFLIAVALHKTLSEFLPANTDIAVKWPNDVLISKKKVAGILLTSKSNSHGDLDWLVIGTGVNIATFPKSTTGLDATSLKNEGVSISVERVLESYCNHLLELYFQWKREGFEPIRQAWLALASGVGSQITVRLPSSEFSGIFTGLDKSGALILTMQDGSSRLVTAGEVFF